MNDFAKYLWELLPRALKQAGSELSRWVTVLGEILEGIKTTVFAVRRSWFIRTAAVDALTQMGADMGVAQYPDEPVESYRQRLLGAFDYYARGGTRRGVEDAVKLVIADPFEIREYPLEAWHLGRAGRSELGASTRLVGASYRAMFGLVFSRPLTPTEEARVRTLVDLTKPAHTTYIIQS